MLGVLKLVVWDVQHGNAIYLKTPGGEDVIIDLGVGQRSDKKKKFSPINHLRNRYELNKIDLLVITHPHKDHIEDIVEAVKLPIRHAILPFHLKKKDYWETSVKSRVPLFKAYQRLSKTFYWRDSINFGQVNFQFFVHTEVGRSRLNDHSVVTVIKYLDKTIIITGDNESNSQRALLKDSSFIKATQNCHVLLAPHHGRKDGYYLPMLKHLNPELTIVSDAKPGVTSFRDKYNKKSCGMEVKIGAIRQSRYVLSTNNDGLIIGELGHYEGGAQFRIQTKKRRRK